MLFVGNINVYFVHRISEKIFFSSELILLRLVDLRDGFEYQGTQGIIFY